MHKSESTSETRDSSCCMNDIQTELLMLVLLMNSFVLVTTIYNKWWRFVVNPEVFLQRFCDI